MVDGGNSGSAYIFTRSGTTWTQQAKLQASDKVNYAQFGYSVAIDGDTAVIGANRKATVGAEAGVVYIYTRSGTTWTEQVKLQASDTQTRQWFGGSVDIVGDTLIVGTEPPGAESSAGLGVYIFTRSGTTWTELAKVQANDHSDYSTFGNAISLSNSTFIVGAVRSRVAYIFEAT